MNYKIFQICFDKDQISKVDSLMIPFDNTENKFPELREYYNFTKVIDDKLTDDLDAWGMFGPRWKEKLRYDSKDIVEEIEKNPNYDVYLFNHARIHDALTFNVWEQGELFHKGIRQVTALALKNSGYDANVLDAMMTDEVTCYCSYFVAKKEFWNEYLIFLKKIKNELENLPEKEKEIYNSSANYSRDANLNLFPFIVERLFSTFLMLNRKFKVHAKPYDYSLYEGALKDFTGVISSLNNMKKLAIKYDSPEIFNNWNLIRDFFIKMTPQLFNLD